MRFAVHRPGIPDASPRSHGVPRRDVPSRVHVSIAGETAGSAPEDGLTLARRPVHLPARRASLARVMPPYLMYPARSHPRGYGAGPAEPHPADLRDPDFAGFPAEAAHVPLPPAPPHDPEPLVPSGLAPRRPARRVPRVKEGGHRLGEVPQGLLLAAALVPAGLGLGFALPSLTVVLLDAIPADQAGLAAGILNSSRQVGGTLAVAVFGALMRTGPPSAPECGPAC